MKKVRIAAIRKAGYSDLMEKNENPIEHACDVEEGQVWIANGWSKPEGFCDSAWDSISTFVMTLAHGGGNSYDGWMRNPQSAMISCNDGFRPVSFLLKGTSKNSPFAVWADLCPQLCAAKIPQYTKYSGISATLFEVKSLAQPIKKEFLEVA